LHSVGDESRKAGPFTDGGFKTDLIFTDIKESEAIYRWRLQNKFDIYRYQRKRGHLPMAASTGEEKDVYNWNKTRRLLTTLLRN
jgi:hypothetical protein